MTMGGHGKHDLPDTTASVQERKLWDRIERNFLVLPTANKSNEFIDAVRKSSLSQDNQKKIANVTGDRVLPDAFDALQVFQGPFHLYFRSVKTSELNAAMLLACPPTTLLSTQVLTQTSTFVRCSLREGCLPTRCAGR